MRTSPHQLGSAGRRFLFVHRLDRRVFAAVSWSRCRAPRRDRISPESFCCCAKTEQAISAGWAALAGDGINAEAPFVFVPEQFGGDPVDGVRSLQAGQVMENPGDPKISLPPSVGETARSSDIDVGHGFLRIPPASSLSRPLLPPDNLDQRSDGGDRREQHDHSILGPLRASAGPGQVTRDTG
jgi:hypothetical protein